MKVLILGGYGTFGGRLAVLLAGEPRFTLLIAGRSHEKAAAFCAALRAVPGARGEAAPLAFDREGDLAAQLRAAAPEIVVDASGPFQAYGAEPYRVVEACIALGIDYLDLADGAEFVAGIARFDAAARARGVYALAGVSSFPVLTAAAVRALLKEGETPESVAAGIAPSPYAGVGLNVIRAIAGYAGKGVPILREGRTIRATALIDSRRFTISPPGAVPLDHIRFSLVDVPDLEAVPALWPSLRSVWVGAGPVPAILHRGLSLLSWLVRLRLVPSLAPLARLFHWAINRLRWGEHRGGMFVSVAGRDAAGGAFARSWHMLAEGDDGPFIPSMAAAAILRRALAGTKPAAGGRPAARELELDDYRPEFGARRIVAGIRDAAEERAAAPLFQRVLGRAWHDLPESIRAFHAREGAHAWEGIASVERGRGLLARAAAALFRFPRAAASVPLRVEIVPRGERKVWRRRFAGRSFTSVLGAGRGRFERLMVERFGPFAFGVALVRDGNTLRYVVRGWSAFGLPLPRAWAPGGTTREFDDGGRFGFDVEIRHALLGLVVRYKGWLVPAPSAGEPEA
jgi:hypothetical protein